MHETTAIGQLIKLLNRDLAPRRAVNWDYRIGALSKPFDRRYVFYVILHFFFSLLSLFSSRFSLLASLFSLLTSLASLFSLLLASLFFFSLLLLCMAIATREWRGRRFSPRGSPHEPDRPSSAGPRFRFFFCFLYSRPGVLG